MGQLQTQPAAIGHARRRQRRYLSGHVLAAARPRRDRLQPVPRGRVTAPQYRVDPALFEYCTVRQLEMLEAINQNKSMKAAARALGVHFNAIRNALRAVERKAAIHGYSPRHDLSRKVAPGFIAKGHSTLYRRGEPEPVLQWVKTRDDPEQREQIIREAVQALMEDVPRAGPIVPPAGTASELCNVYTLTDCHVGM